MPHIWIPIPKVEKSCRTCGTSFLGYNQKIYCSIDCRPKRVSPTSPQPTTYLRTAPRPTPARQGTCDSRRYARLLAVTRTLTAKQWEEIKAAYGHRCVYCGRKMQRLTRDHITPIIYGGHHTAQNIVPACKSCNSKKGTGKPLVPVQPLLLTVA